MTLTAAARSVRARSARGIRASMAVPAAGSVLAALLAAPAAADTGTDTGTGTYDICPTVYYYVVPAGSPGLEGIADLVLGDPERADEIYGYNAGRTQADGGALGEDRRVLPEWRLVVPFDAGGEGVYEGLDPLCVVAVDRANALGQEPPSPPPAPPAYTPPPEDGSSAEAAATDLTAEEEPSIDPRLLAAGAAGLILLTLITLFWQPIGRALAWPFRRVAAARAERPQKRRPSRPGAAARRRRAATDLIASDPDAVRRAGAAHAELIGAPADVPARPVALLTTPSETTAVVPAGATPPASWRAVDTTTWRYGSGRSSAPVHFGTSVHTMTDVALRGVLVCLGQKEGTDALVHVDFTRMRGLLAVDGDPKVAADAVRVVADGLHAAGLQVRVLKQGRPLHSLLPDTIPVVTAPDPIHGLDPGAEPPTVVVVPRPLGQADEHVLTGLPSDTIVVAAGSSHTARWQWEAFDDGTVHTGALGIDVVLRTPGRRD
ncbi:hypothetical protein CQJ94_19180 [Glycomyces fuscus]|nr:hypothetical protein CQJ94_19180 [Glycomyces fuscus]